MQPEPTGRVIRAGQHTFDLILSRTFTDPPESLWASFTDPEQASLWIGRWKGSPGTGQTVDVQMLYEDGQPQSQVRISECARPELLRLLAEDEYGSWDLEVRLLQHSSGTRLDFIHHLDDPAAAESTGPGWEYYLDRLGAVRSGGAVPDFGDYYPGHGAYYAALAQAAAATSHSS